VLICGWKGWFTAVGTPFMSRITIAVIMFAPTN
jgi:hypothetical protein